jgi:hypothetical protein
MTIAPSRGKGVIWTLASKEESGYTPNFHIQTLSSDERFICLHYFYGLTEAERTAIKCLCVRVRACVDGLHNNALSH